MFVLDVTGSMDREITGVRQGIQNFAAALNTQNLDGQVGLIGFRDRLFGEEPQLLQFGDTAFTADINQFSQQIRSLIADGGGDDLESSFDALALAAQQQYRPDATKVLLLITDAPPKVPDQDMRSLTAVQTQLRAADIDQLHLVVPDSILDLYQPLQTAAPGEVFPLSETDSGRANFDQILPSIGREIAETALSLEQRTPVIEDTLAAGKTATAAKINLVAVGTGDADKAFLAQLTGTPKQVFFAEAGEFDKAFETAGEIIGQAQLVDPEPGDYGVVYGPLRIGGWTALLAIGTTLALIVGQNRSLRRRWLTVKEWGGGTVGGLVAGLSAGALGQLVFLTTSHTAVIAAVPVTGTLIGWTVLGVLVGGGMSVFVPNLSRGRALVGGGLGGVAGSLGYWWMTGVAGPIVGRLVGATLLGFAIGVMIALLERLAQEVWLQVEWTAMEHTQIPLGADPILLGSSDRCHIYLRKDQGYPPVAAQIFMDEDTVVLEYDPRMQQLRPGMKVLHHQLKPGDRRKLGDITFTVKAATPNLQRDQRQ